MKSAALSSISMIPSPLAYANRVDTQIKALLQQLDSLGPKSTRKEIHDLRVLSRRSRASLQILLRWIPSSRAKKLEKRIEEITALLGPVRSLDVSQVDLKKHLEKWSLPPSSFDFLMGRLKRRRKLARKKLIRQIKKQKTLSRLKKLAPLNRSKEDPSLSFTEVLLEETQTTGERLLKVWARFERKKKISRLHEVRIELKKWRYLLEIQSEFTGSPSEAHLKEVKTVQDRLGLIHDAEVLNELLGKRRILKKAPRGAGLVRLRDRLGSEIKTGVDSFHKEGEKILLQLFTERTGA